MLTLTWVHRSFLMDKHASVRVSRPYEVVIRGSNPRAAVPNFAVQTAGRLLHPDM